MRTLGLSFLNLGYRGPLGSVSNAVTRSLSVVGSGVVAADQASYTFSGVSFGAADADRTLILAVTYRGGTLFTPTSITIGGVAATLAAESRNSASGNSTTAALYYASVPNGTSGDVVLAFAGTLNRCGIVLYRAIGVDGLVPYATDTATLAAGSGSMNGTLSFTEFGFTIGTAYAAASANQMTTSASQLTSQGFASTVTAASAAGNTTWSGATEDVDVVMEVGGTSAPQAMVVAGWRFKDDVPNPLLTEVLATGRLNQMGYSGISPSNGTDTGQNSRISCFNESGTGITALKVGFSNFYATATNEQAGANPITVRAAVEYPAGTYTSLLFSGVRDTVIAAGNLTVSDAVSVTIPDDAQYWIRTYVTVTAGQTWPRGYVISGTRGEASDTGTATSDLTTSGTPAGSGAAYGPVLVKATGFARYPSKIALASIGDSILMGAGDGNFDARGNTGWNGRASFNRVPHVNIAITGTTASDNIPANFTRRLEILRNAGITHVLCDWGNNDLAGGRTVSEIQADLLAIWNSFHNEGFKVIHATFLPRSSSTDNWTTLANQTVSNSGFTGGASSRRAQLNNWIRTLPAPLFDYVETADAVESARDSGLWKINGAWANPSYTNDGIHPNVTSTSNSQGGHYAMRDVLIPKINTWLT